ncbi:MAG TPA: hypothetical protein VGS57_12005 [Thermoanaerobaculia bacterium]|jgi:hypothetical protein|nr:hypothetical protein [Thermoanaerobaculia bacterium]
MANQATTLLYLDYSEEHVVEILNAPTLVGGLDARAEVVLEELEIDLIDVSDVETLRSWIMKAR